MGFLRKKRTDEFNMKDVEEFFEKLGLANEEFEQMDRLWTENFMIQGEVSTELDDIIKRMPDSLLDTILETWEAEKEESASREEKEKIVRETIIRSFCEEFLYLDRDDLEILLKTMNGHPLSPLEIAELELNYCRKGWAFMFYQEDGGQFAVPEEIREIIYSSLEDQEKVAGLGFVTAIRLTLRACLNLFGVVERRKVCEIVKNSMLKYEECTEDERKTLEPFLPKIEKVLDILCEREESCWRDGEWIISEDFEDRREYRHFLRNVSGREYYIPGSDAISKYAQNQVDVENPQYKKVLANLTRILKDRRRADNLMFEIEYKVVQEDLNDAGVMNLLYEQEVEFPSRVRAETFAKECGDWIYEVRKWSNRGFTDKELGKRKKVSKGLPELEAKVQAVNTKKKIGRNDPCPCGSGKKYKKCCGK